MRSIGELLSLDDLIQYPNEEEAQQAFLKEYCGHSKYNRKKAAEVAGLPWAQVKYWFTDVKFFAPLEKALRAAVRSKSRIREHVINKALQFSQAQLTDCLFTDPATGELSLLPLNQIPEGTKAALKKLEVGRIRSFDEVSKTWVYRDVLKIELADTTPALALLGKWANIEAEEKKNIQGEEIPKFTGLTLVLPDDKPKELTHEHSIDPIGEVFANGKTDGDSQETGAGK